MSQCRRAAIPASSRCLDIGAGWRCAHGDRDGLDAVIAEMADMPNMLMTMHMPKQIVAGD
jgi:hypothetical protein